MNKLRLRSDFHVPPRTGRNGGAALGVCMTVLFYVVVYASFLIFAVACIARAIRYSRFPLHLRWELYPVPHEPPERVAHGGSYFEISNWWTEKRKYNLGGELAAMIPEMLFLKGLWEFNRRLWRVSFLFHFGLYLLIATIAMVFAAAVLSTGVVYRRRAGVGHYLPSHRGNGDSAGPGGSSRSAGTAGQRQGAA